MSKNWFKEIGIIASFILIIAASRIEGTSFEVKLYLERLMLG